MRSNWLEMMLPVLCVPLVIAGCARPVLAPAPQPGGDPVKFATYPAGMPVGEDLDIVVSREAGSLVLTNRTPRAYERVNLWLNQQYGARVKSVPIGRARRVPLTRLKNHHGEPFPVGGLLTPDLAEPLRLAEMVISHEPAEPTAPASEPTRKRHRLLVRD